MDRSLQWRELLEAGFFCDGPCDVQSVYLQIDCKRPKASQLKKPTPASRHALRYSMSNFCSQHRRMHLSPPSIAATLSLAVLMIIFGIHAVEEALSARGRGFDYVAVVPGRGDARIQKIAQLCRANGVPLRTMPRDQITRLAKAANHQGVVAVTAETQYGDLDDVLAHKRGQHAFVLLLDGIEDPHNLGAIIRTAEGAGADGIIIPERRAAGVTGTVIKASAGAAE